MDDQETYQKFLKWLSAKGGEYDYEYNKKDREVTRKWVEVRSPEMIAKLFKAYELFSAVRAHPMYNPGTFNRNKVEVALAKLLLPPKICKLVDELTKTKKAKKKYKSVPFEKILGLACVAPRRALPSCKNPDPDYITSSECMALNLVSKCSLEVWVQMGLVCKRWYHHRASYREMFTQYAFIATAHITSISAPCFSYKNKVVLAPIPKGVRLPTRVRTSRISTSLTYGDGTTFRRLKHTNETVYETSSVIFGTTRLNDPIPVLDAKTGIVELVYPMMPTVKIEDDEMPINPTMPTNMIEYWNEDLYASPIGTVLEAYAPYHDLYAQVGQRVRSSIVRYLNNPDHPEMGLEVEDWNIAEHIRDYHFMVVMAPDEEHLSQSLELLRYHKNLKHLRLFAFGAGDEDDEAVITPLDVMAVETIIEWERLVMLDLPHHRYTISELEQIKIQSDSGRDIAELLVGYLPEME